MDEAFLSRSDHANHELHRIREENLEGAGPGEAFYSNYYSLLSPLLPGSLHRQPSSVYSQQKAGAEREQKLSPTLLGTSKEFRNQTEIFRTYNAL